MNRIELGNKVYNLALSTYIIQAIGVFSSLENKPFLGYLTYLILLLLGIKIILSYYTKKQLFWAVTLLGFGIWLYYITGLGDLMLFMWFIISGRDVKLRKTFRMALKVYVFSILFAIALYAFGYSTDVVKRLTDGSLGHSLGFSNANSLSLLFFQPILIWIVLRYERFKFRDYAGILLAELIIYLITRCRSTFITSIILLFLLPNIKTLSSHKYSKRVLKILVYVAPICAALSFLLVYLYSRGGAVVSVIDSLGSSRISSAYINIIRYGIHFFPTANNPVYESLYTLDNSYIRVAVHFGTFVLIFVLFFYTRSMWFMYKREEYERLTVMVIICILSLFETNLYRLSINVAILLLSEGLYSSMLGNDPDHSNVSKV